MPERVRGHHSIKQELERRIGMWNALITEGGPQQVPPTLLRALGIYGGAQGVWVNKQITGGLADAHTGVTVGLLHTGTSYADDLSSDGVLYHYPNTARPPGRDLSEVNATKASGKLSLPVFVITPSGSSTDRRDVHLGWVEDWDDSLRIFLVAFGDDIGPQPVPVRREEPFELTEKRKPVKKEVKVRRGQQYFKFYVFQRYGHECAVCNLSIPEVLDAAHIVPDRYEGSYDPRNGLVLCATHHRAYDAGLFAIEPSTLKLHYTGPELDANVLKIDYETLEHLPRQPHMDALRWRWDRWQPLP